MGFKHAFRDRAEEVISDLKKDQSKFKAKAWANPEVKAFLNRTTSRPKEIYASQGYFPSRGGSQYGSSSSNFSRKLNSSSGFATKRLIQKI